jgi:hypothetical protein
MKEIPAIARPLFNVGRLYARYKAGEISERAYLQVLGHDSCATLHCATPATEYIEARHYCDVCAARVRRQLDDVAGLPFDDTRTR